MQSSSLITKVYNNVDRTDLSRADITQYLNNRKDTICNLDNFSFMEVLSTGYGGAYPILTVSSTQKYVLPTDYKDELQMWLWDGSTKTPLIKWVGKEAENNYTNSTLTAKPFAYWVWGGYYWLWPLPDAVYTLELKYYRYLADITDVASEENELEQKYPDLMIDGATADSFGYFHQPDKEAEWEAKWDKELSKLVRRESKRRVTNYDSRMKLKIK